MVSYTARSAHPHPVCETIIHIEEFASRFERCNIQICLQCHVIVPLMRSEQDLALPESAIACLSTYNNSKYKTWRLKRGFRGSGAQSRGSGVSPNAHHND